MALLKTDADARWYAIRDARRSQHLIDLARIDVRTKAKGLSDEGRMRQHLAADELYLSNSSIDLRGIALSERSAPWALFRVLWTDGRLARWCCRRLKEEMNWLFSLVPVRFKGVPEVATQTYRDLVNQVIWRQTKSMSAKIRRARVD